MVQYYPHIFALLLGLAAGSFGNVLICRVPHKQSIVTPRSHCPACGKGIAWYDNVPPVSWLLLRGRCRHCGESISIRYPLVELTSGLLFLLFAFLLADWRFFLFYLPLLVLVIPLTLIDYDHQLLPDRLVYPLMIIGLLFNAVNALLPFDLQLFPWWEGVAGAAFAWILFTLVAVGSRRLLGKEGLGGGDIKLVTALGLYTGLQGIMVGIFLASLLGVIWQGALMIIRQQRGRYFPFGPYLLLGVLIAILWGDRMVRLYLNWAF